jgi:hypothetical protein
VFDEKRQPLSVFKPGILQMFGIVPIVPGKKRVCHLKFGQSKPHLLKSIGAAEMLLN